MNIEMRNALKALFYSILAVSFIAGSFITFAPKSARAVSGGVTLFLSPPSGGFVVGSTFTVSVLLDTGGNSINALQADISFPPDKLQVVSPSLGYSIINVWTNQPRFDNQQGTLSFQGGLPNPGINTSKGVVATITFRVKSIGQSLVRILDSSKVLLNDGLGTDILTNRGNGIYQLTLPPPRGPFIVSETHPEQSHWYANSSVALQWSDPFPVEGYSYMVNDEPIDIPDNTSEGTRANIVYKGLSDGTHFFHIKALRSGVWGETSHYAVNIDATPPADFPIEISPSSYTSNRQPLIHFLTTDAVSGMDHYEVKIVPRFITTAVGAADGAKQSFFTEANSPFSTQLQVGTYDVLVRAYDKAGNYREKTQSLHIVTPLLQILGIDLLPRWVMILLGLALLSLLSYLAIRIWRWSTAVHLRYSLGALKDPEIMRRIKELQQKRSGYFKNLIIFLCLAVTFFGFASTGKAQTALLAPPVISTVAKDISNEEIFYVGGKAVAPGGSVIIYLQNLHDGETFSAATVVDSKGDWFYSFDNFLSPGQYLVWVQLKVGAETSAPSSQQQITVSQTAIQFGASRLSYETLYLVFVFILLISIIVLLAFILYHGYHGRIKHQKLRKEILEAEEAIKRGFLLLRRDLQAELEVVKRDKGGSADSIEGRAKEAQLVKDLEWVNKYIEKEIRDVERLISSE